MCIKGQKRLKIYKKTKELCLPVDKYLDRIRHDLESHLLDLFGERCGDDDNLRGSRKVSIDVVDLALKSLLQHLIRLIQNQHLDALRRQLTPLYQL